jgi:hypothetical protein
MNSRQDAKLAKEESPKVWNSGLGALGVLARDSPLLPRY